MSLSPSREIYCDPHLHAMRGKAPSLSLWTLLRATLFLPLSMPASVRYAENSINYATHYTVLYCEESTKYQCIECHEPGIRSQQYQFDT